MSGKAAARDGGRAQNSRLARDVRVDDLLGTEESRERYPAPTLSTAPGKHLPPEVRAISTRPATRAPPTTCSLSLALTCCLAACPETSRSLA